MTVEGTVTIPLSEYEAMQWRLGRQTGSEGFKAFPDEETVKYSTELRSAPGLGFRQDSRLCCTCGEDTRALIARIDALLVQLAGTCTLSGMLGQTAGPSFDLPIPGAPK